MRWVGSKANFALPGEPQTALTNLPDLVPSRVLSALLRRPLNAGHVRFAGTRALALRLGVGIAIGLLVPRSMSGHEIPSRVTVLALAKPEGTRLHLLVRVPLGALRDMEFPVRGAGYLDLSRVGPYLPNAARLWLADYLRMFEGDRELGNEELVAARVSLPSDRSFESFDEAAAHIAAAAIPAETEIPWQQAMLDVHFVYTIESDSARFAIEPMFARLGLQTTTVLRFVARGGAERAFRLTGDPGLVRLDPGWWQATARFIAIGFAHILDGIDHLLFVFCLVIPVRRPRALVAIVSAFTLAHSLTLMASAAGFAPNALWFPPLIETLIALSIVYMAFENIAGARLDHRWMMAFAFGLVHGFGFSFALRESMQFAGSHLVWSLLAFNVGVEFGQLFVLVIALPALAFLYRRVSERAAAILLSALVAHTAWHWMTDRGSGLRDYDWSLPPWDTALAISAMRFTMLALLIVGAAWGMRALVTRFAAPPTGAPDASPPV